MGILRKQPTRWANALLLSAMTLAGAGCMILSKLAPKEQRFAFSHAVHIAEELECGDCHPGALDSDEPGMPALGQCMLCHDGIDAEKPAEKKISNLFVGGKLAAAHVTKLDPEVKFSHARHVATGESCGACHAGIETNAVIEPEHRISMDQCTQCHDDKQQPNECADCHEEIRADALPPSHTRQWMKLHGPAVRGASGEIADRCSLCHTESSCVTCHRETPPENHNNFWRIRGHGVAASLDRQGCAVCHTEDTCSSCHAETLPLSHTGTWGAPKDSHCVSCHFPLSDNGCSACHPATPSHALATPMPPGHTLGMNCRQCHGVTQPLPHVDNGTACTMCHR